MLKCISMCRVSKVTIWSGQVCILDTLSTIICLSVFKYGIVLYTFPMGTGSWRLRKKKWAGHCRGTFKVSCLLMLPPSNRVLKGSKRFGRWISNTHIYIYIYMNSSVYSHITWSIWTHSDYMAVKSVVFGRPYFQLETGNNWSELPHIHGFAFNVYKI